MTRVQRLRALGLALGAVIIVTALTFVGYSMQHSTTPVHASGVGDGGPCLVPTGSTPTCQFKGFTASAYYTHVDTSTCANGVYTSYAVWASDNVEINPSSSPTGGPLVSVAFSQWNSCTYAYASYYGETTTGSVMTTGNLGSATAQATVQLYDWSYTPGPTVTVNVTWTGFGDISSSTDAITHRTGDTLYKSRYTGSDRQAAVSGTLSDGTSTYPIATTNTMADAQGGTILIEHA